MSLLKRLIVIGITLGFIIGYGVSNINKIKNSDNSLEVVTE